MPLFDASKKDETALSPWLPSLPSLGHSPKQESEDKHELPPLAAVQQNPSGKQSDTIKENVKETKKESEKKSESGDSGDEPYVPFADMFGEDPDFAKYQKQDKLPDKYIPPTGADAKELQYSPFGLPLTPDAWAMQTAIDGGKLHYLYDKLKESPEFQKQFAGKKPDEIASDPTFNQTVIDKYLKEAAKMGDKGAFMGEFLPTETGNMGDALGKIKDHALTGDPGALRDMQATKTVSQIRLGNAQIADQFKNSDNGKGRELFSLVVPYSNTVENIINNDGRPKDGADKLAEYMNYFGKDSKTTTMATGYSQGGAAARTYLEDYGDKQGLDYSVMLAPMGGNNGRGEDGIWGGMKNGVQTLGIENKYDPARGLWDRKGEEGADKKNPLAGWLPGMPSLNLDLYKKAADFVTSPNGWLHGDANKEDANLGTYGYPVKDLMPWTKQLFNNGFKDEKNPNTFDKKAEWDHHPEQAPPGQKFDPNAVGDKGEKVSGWDFAKTVGGILWDKGKSWAGEQINNVTEGAKEKWEGVKHGASDLWNGAKEKVSDGWQSAKDTVSGWFGGGKKQVKNNDVGNASHGWEGAKEKEKPKKEGFLQKLFH